MARVDQDVVDQAKGRQFLNAPQEIGTQHETVVGLVLYHVTQTTELGVGG